MRKSRRKADIRARAATELEELARQAAERASFRQLRPQGWHDLFLKALGDGATIAEAAQIAGVTRAGVRYARQHNRRFAEAYRSAYGKGLRSRYERSAAGIIAANGWTIDSLHPTMDATQ